MTRRLAFRSAFRMAVTGTFALLGRVFAESHDRATILPTASSEPAPFLVPQDLETDRTLARFVEAVGTVAGFDSVQFASAIRTRLASKQVTGAR